MTTSQKSVRKHELGYSPLPQPMPATIRYTQKAQACQHAPRDLAARFYLRS